MTIRAQQKLKTRTTLVNVALDLVAGGRSFSSLSLREVTRAAGVVPTAFYRHFTNMEALGIAIVDEVLPRLRQRIRSSRQPGLTGEEALVASVDLFFDFVLQHDREFIFFGREITGGCATLRESLRLHTLRFVHDLADDMQRIGLGSEREDADRFLAADLVVRAVLTTSQDLILLRSNPPALEILRDRTAEQVRLVVRGLAQRPREAA